MGNLTNAQKSIWVTEQYYKGSSINNICGTAVIQEKVDFEKLKKSIQIVCKKHDNFWLEFKLNKGNVEQVLSEKKEIQIDTINIAGKNQLELERNKIVKTRFQLENSKLFKFYIFKFIDGKGAFMLNIHHLISDAWTLALICNDIIKTYSELIQNKEVETKAIYSYIDYIKSEQQYQESEKYNKDKQYWLERFKTIPEVATIPGSIKGNIDETNPAGERKQYKISKENVAEIKNYCKENKISLYNFFMAIYAIYIGEVSNLDEFTIGTPILNRTNYKEKNAAGMFINMAPFRININEDIEFKQFIKNIARDSMDMLKHQKYSYQCLLEELRKENKSIPNLYNILLSYQITNAKQNEGNIEYETEWTFNGYCADNIDIQIYDLNDTGNLNIAYDYKTSIYKVEDIENIHKRILNIIKQVVSKEEIKLSEIDIVTPEEKEKLLVEFNKTELKYDENIPFIKYFEKQVEKTPDDIAIVFEDKEMTYRELNERANSLAYKLRENEVTNNTVVGILLERSFEMLISMLAVLKSGGSYIPIAPDYPKDRIEYMLEDSEATIILTSQNRRNLADKKLINVKDERIYENHKENLENISKPEDLSYLIYTSGSTGTPKGVMLKQKNLSNFYNSMKNIIEYLKDGKNHKILSITTVSFDIFGFETLMSLTRGLIVYLTSENGQKMTSKIERIVKDSNVEIMQTTPSVMKFHLENLNDENSLKSLKYIMLAGEPLTKTLVDRIKQIIPNVTIYNGYGPSETTIFSTIGNATNQEEITIGKPINNTQIYILNKNKKVMPQGTIGELYISGDGVGKGYMNKEQQTNASFIINPFIDGKVMYKVGDLGAFDDKGEITCYGRIDNQVKIRGLRIELQEIEKRMQSVYNIHDCVVVKKVVKGKDALCAYYVERGHVSKSVLKTVLYSKLPEYMVPQYFVKMEQLPHTPNGKVDRKALPDPVIDENELEIVKPRNEIDKELIKIIEKMLQVDKIGINNTLLELGGDSLTAITLTTKVLSKFNVQLNIKDILSNYTIKDMSDYIAENQTKDISKVKIEKVPIQDTYPLSSAQKRIYYSVKMIGEDNIVYNMPGAVLVEKILDIEKIKKVFSRILKRHSILRTRFIFKDNDIRQQVESNVDLEIPVFYNKKDEIKNIVMNFSKPFNLEKEPLIRMEVHYIDNKETLVLMDAHHIIMDGISLNNFIIEFERLYNGDNLKNIPIQYKDYSVWEEKYNESDDIKEKEDYWVNKFKNSEFEQLNLPYDYKATALRSYNGDRVTNIIDEKKFRKIERYAKKIGVSPYMFFISVFYILLYKYTGQSEIILGSPIANRDKNEMKRMIGMFVNNIVTKANINSEETFQNFLNEMREQILDDISHQPYPFDMLVKRLGIKTDNSRNPLFDVMFTYQNNQENILKLDNTETQIVEINNNIAKFNLSLEIKPKSHTINIEYCTDLFKKETIERLFEHYINAIDFIMNDVNAKIKDIEIISNTEKNKILYEFNDTKMEYPKDKTITELFEEQVEKTPNDVAVVFEDNKLTYKEVNEKANQLARYLREEKNIKPNDIVGVMLPRSIELISTLIGVLKSGACYIPIDPTYPEKRIEYMLENSDAKFLLTNEELFQKLNFENRINVYSKEIKIQDYHNLKNVNTSTDRSYIIYTSGSTGLPKGVVLKHQSLTNLCSYLNKNVEFLHEDCEYKNMASVTTVSFDIFVFETLVCLQRGFRIILANEDEQRIPQHLNELIKKNNVQLIQMTPSRMQIFLDNIDEIPNLNQLKYVTLAGEALPLRLRDELLKLGVKKVYNGYGPSETTVFSTFTDVTKMNEINIGIPISNTQIYILDRNLNIVPIGVAGELYISGDGVGLGYLNREDLTNERYINNPFFSNSVMYKTGDICKYDNNGQIYYLERADNQVKIRGLRIELEEIENKMLEYPGIKKAKVIKQTIGNREIISAYYIASKRIRITELRKHLYSKLPNYMIPSYFTALDDFPYTPNGKIDKKSLPIPNGILQSEKNNYIAPKTDLEIKLVSIWENILNMKPIGIKDNFFELGGDSILAMNLNVQLLKITNKITYSDIFAYPTIMQLAEKIEEKISNEKEEKDLTYLNKKYGKILNENMNIPLVINENKCENILLTGVTGFLGIHILDEFLKKENGKIYVIIRKDPGQTINDKLTNKLHYYFNEKYDKYVNNRIITLEGDISKSGFGLNQEELFKLGNSVDLIINSAAKVSHYGNYQEFYNTNVKSVEKIIDFANAFKKKIFHISTLSVSGNSLVDEYYVEQKINKEIDFCEDNFYIGQSFENVYIRSKFEAEKRILDAIQKGTDAYILRVGNLMPRREDGKFQENISENAYITRLKTFIKIGYLPQYLKDGYLEFTPIDSTAQAIMSIVKHTNTQNRIYHVFNHNHVYLKDLLKEINSIKIITDDEFKEKIKSILKSSDLNVINTLLNDLDKNLNLNYNSNIKIKSKHSIELLKQYGFEWPIIDKNYINYILELIKENDN
ncbi:MAG: hypothetical protein BHV99_05085 [Clostridium sp. 26_21]|nr:MAG: hypothetical protein BHV99_05085 [Clostridium sp. 26_21]